MCDDSSLTPTITFLFLTAKGQKNIYFIYSSFPIMGIPNVPRGMFYLIQPTFG